MITRYAHVSDYVSIARTMRKAGCATLCSKRSLMTYHKSGGKIILTEDAGICYAFVFARVAQEVSDEVSSDADSIVLLIEPMSFETIVEEYKSVCVCESLSRFMKSVLASTGAEYATTIMHDCSDEYFALMHTVGFLRKWSCSDCKGGEFIFAGTDEHQGSVVIERILDGNVETWGG